MEKLSKNLKKYLLVLTAAMMLILFSAAPAFATEISEYETQPAESETQPAESETGDAVPEEITEQMLELAKTVKLELEQDTAVYSGSAIEVPVKRVYYVEDGQEIDANEQFAVSEPEYSNNLNVSTSEKPAAVSVKITGYYEKDADGSYVTDDDGRKVTHDFDYAVTVTAEFKIEPADISETAKLSLSADSFTYNGKAQKPAVSVQIGSVTLSSDNYSVSYINSSGETDKCINAGTKTVTVTGKGNYKGTLTGSFTIKPKSISEASVSLSASSYAYNGKDRKPGTTVKIKLSSTVTLKKDTDYTVSYGSDCKSIGTRTVTVKGKGNYTGSVKKNYIIVPEKASGLKVSQRTTSSLTVQCSAAKVSGCKYEFLIKNYNVSTEKWEKVASKKTSSNSVTFKGLDAGRAYAVYVRIYKTADSRTYTGSWSSVLKTITTPAKPVMSYATKTGSKSMKVVWKAVSSATGYEIQYSTKSDFSSNVKTVKVKGRTTTSKTISNLSSGKIYYVRVRAYRTYNDKTCRGAWSSKVSTCYSNVYASYSTTYNSSNKNRTTNLQLACKAINGKVLSNGQTFSFNGTVGQRTKAKGYKEAIIYENGQEVGGIGGGICQVATTLFNAALKANFKIVERHQHSLTVHYCPLGYDAAIAWGSKNLRFTNNSGTSVKIDIHATNGTLSVKFLTNIYKKPPKVTTKVTVKNGVYTLKRYVNGKVNYTTKSDYLDN